MPFTPAHPAIILPFLRIGPERISATALVIGSTAPDFEYFFKMSVNSYYSHTMLSILYFNIPITLALAFLFHEVVKRNLITNLPAFFQYRFQPILELDFVTQFKRHYWVVIISAGIGSFSHIFWDAFTHNDGFFAQRISLYKHVVIPFDGARYPLFYGLQYISTFVGLAIVIIYMIILKPNKTIKASNPRIVYWVIIILISAVVLFLRFFFNREDLTEGNFVVSTVSAILVATLTCGFIKFNKRAIT